MLTKRLFAVLILTLAFLALLPLSGAFASSSVADDPPPAQASAEVVGPNLLTNPGMEGKYVKQCSLRNGPHWVQVPCPADYNEAVGTIKQWETAQVPYGWSAWWRQPNNNFDDPNYFTTWPAYCPDRPSTPADCIAHHNPEYRDTLGGPQETGPSRKVAGDNSQKYFTFYSIHEAGLYQVVSGVKPGDRLRFTIFMEGWSTGSNDPWSSNIIWSEPGESFDKFTQFAVEAVAKNSVVSVWTKSRPVYALQHVDVYADEASLNVVQPAKTAKAPVKSTRVVTSTKIITTTRQITGTDGIVYTALITKSVVVTRTVAVTTSQSTNPVTTTKSTKPVTSTTSTKPVTSTSSTKPVTSTASTAPISGTLPIPASGTYTVVRGDTLIAIARRFGITPWLRLAELNNLQEPYKIETGQVLKLR